MWYYESDGDKGTSSETHYVCNDDPNSSFYEKRIDVESRYYGKKLKDFLNYLDKSGSVYQLQFINKKTFKILSIT